MATLWMSNGLPGRASVPFPFPAFQALRQRLPLTQPCSSNATTWLRPFPFFGV